MAMSTVERQRSMRERMKLKKESCFRQHIEGWGQCITS
jgi:hypothetical protein